MPKHHHEEENEILEFIENPGALINLIIKNKKDKDWSLKEIMHGGPKHKQVYSVLLLQRMHELVKAVEQQTGKTFAVQKGITITSHKDEAEIAVPLVLKGIKKQNQDAVAEAL